MTRINIEATINGYIVTVNGNVVLETLRRGDAINKAKAIAATGGASIRFS